MPRKGARRLHFDPGHALQRRLPQLVAVRAPELAIAARLRVLISAFLIRRQTRVLIRFQTRMTD
jgi:hypothetical protein